MYKGAIPGVIYYFKYLFPFVVLYRVRVLLMCFL